jgi:anti-sigma28 factor (negative regulator of flagellin synthesis)
MKLSGPGSNSPSGLDPSAGVSPAGQGTAAPKQPIAPNPQSDQVQLSSLSAYLASALQGSPAHVAKIIELSSAVSTGQYHVDSYAVSGSIIQHGIEFGGAGYSALTS